MGFTSDLIALVDQRIKYASKQDTYIGTVTKLSGGYASVQLDGADSNITAKISGHVNAYVNSRVVVLRVLFSGYLIIADIGQEGYSILPKQPVQLFEEDSDFTFTNTGYGGGATLCGGVFTAPASGRVTLIVGSFCGPDTIDTLRISTSVRTGDTVGAGTEVAGASDVYAYQPATSPAGILSMGSGMPRIVSGLIPGSTYNVHTRHRMTGGTGDMRHRSVLVIPDN